MECRDARDELLRSEVLSVDGLSPGALASHLAGCAACRQRLVELAQLERTWRTIPMPAGSERPPQALLDQLARPAARPRRRPLRPSRWLIAASVLLALGVVGGLLVPSPRTASADIVERLVDWNLRLARTPAAADRDRLYVDQAAGLEAEVRNARLPDGDRGLAESLLETAPWLARNDDPLGEADRFNDVADRLVNGMSRATRGGDRQRLERYARLLGRVRELGIESKLDVLEASESLDFDRQRRLERLVLRDASRMRTLVALLERAPDSSRKEIKRALGVPRKRPRAADAAAPASRRKRRP